MNLKDFRRVKKLAELDLDYLELRQDLKPFSQLAAQIAGAELSEVNLIDNCTQWTVASTLGGFSQKPREEAICNFTIEEEEDLMVHLPTDPRFENSNYVVDEGYKLYYGIPLKFDDNIAIGALCVAGKSIEDLDNLQIKQLHLIAEQILKHLGLKFELKQTQKAVLYERKLKRQLAHDVRSPLSGISQLVEITDFNCSSKAELENVIRLIASSANAILELTDEILNEITAHGDSMKAEHVFTFECLASKLKNLYIPQAESKQIEFHVHYDEHKRQFTDKNLLPLIGNLISNAIKFTDRGGKVNVYFDVIGRTPKNEKIRIQVEDTGCGMSKEQIATMEQVDLEDRLPSSDLNGFGMGLLLVRELTENLKGDLKINSTPGGGTQVEVNLPLL